MSGNETARARELIVDAKPAPGDSSDGAGSAMAPVAVPVVVAGLLAKFASPAMGAVVLAGAIALLVLRRKPREGRFVLRVLEDGLLEVTRERPARESSPLRVVLTDVLDVTLDAEKRPSGRGGATTERLRLALERAAPSEPIFVPDERITPIEAQEWLGKVRVFLRKHGWVPEDERREPG